MRKILIILLLNVLMLWLLDIMHFTDFPKDALEIITSEELIINKPRMNIQLNEATRVLQNGKEVGCLQTSAFIYPLVFGSANQVNNIYVYGWIWAGSVSYFDKDQIRLKNPENIRIASNQMIIGGLLKNAVGRKIFENSRKTWILARFEFFLDIDNFCGNSVSKHKYQATQTNTSTGGGAVPDGGTEIWPLILFLSFVYRNKTEVAIFAITLSLFYVFLSVRRPMIDFFMGFVRKK